MENYNALPSAIRDEFESGKGFKNAQTANQGVAFFNSSEEEKGENRAYWYFARNVMNVVTVPLNENTSQEVLDYFNQKDETPEEEPTE